MYMEPQSTAKKDLLLYIVTLFSAKKANWIIITLITKVILTIEVNKIILIFIHIFIIYLFICIFLG